jgi:penicillin G amidase
MVDLIEKEKTVRAFQGTVGVRLLRHFAAAGVVAFALAAAYIGYAAAGMYASATTSGTVSGLALDRSARIYRDERDFPHIRAASDRDAYFAEGFAQGSDRLFQMDLFRRYVYGRLAEVLGPIQLGTDETMRALDVGDIVEREWHALSPGDRIALVAFSDGVNAAMRTQPLPVEFRLLLYKPEPWKARDSLAVTLAISSSLGDTADNVMRRDFLWSSLGRRQFAQLLPLSDAAYDVPATGAPRAQPGRQPALAWASRHRVGIPAFGSNAWAAGGSKTRSGRALIANDPHLNVGIPDVWYALELHTPHLHVAGVTVPGIPGVVLGHNERIAWASTNAVVSTLSVFRPKHLSERNWHREVFHVRFSHDAVHYYYRTDREFAQQTSQGTALVRWTPYTDPRSAIHTVLALNRANGVREAMHVLRSYAGPPQNFLIAGTDGTVAYHLAGPIPRDPAWGRYAHEATESNARFAPIPFERLPSVAPSRSAVILSANNKMYGPGYPYRLSAMFAPPYRAYRIAQLLHARSVYDAEYFERMQLDAVSPADAEFAHRVAAYAKTHDDFLSAEAAALLERWQGGFSPASRAATVEHALRSAAETLSLSPYTAFDAVRQPHQSTQYMDALRSVVANDARVQPWEHAGEIHVFHPFGPIGFPFLNGTRFPGNGDQYTIRVQTAGLSQSFRAVWEAGNWDAGGLSLPTGESGQVGSDHYDDLSATWVRGELQPLPFSDAAVARAARQCLLLEQ